MRLKIGYLSQISVSRSSFLETEITREYKGVDLIPRLSVNLSRCSTCENLPHQSVSLEYHKIHAM